MQVGNVGERPTDEIAGDEQTEEPKVFVRHGLAKHEVERCPGHRHQGCTCHCPE